MKKHPAIETTGTIYPDAFRIIVLDNQPNSVNLACNDMITRIKQTSVKNLR